MLLAIGCGTPDPERCDECRTENTGAAIVVTLEIEERKPHMRRILLCLALAACIAGCGLKGPLYLPTGKPAPKEPLKPVPTTPATGAGQPS